MKYFVLITLALLVQSCASFKTGRNILMLEINECIAKQIEYYDDLCAEESSGYEEMKTWEAHRQGVICASESIKSCINK